MLSIFTPTYNRKSCLPRLYESLCKQDNKNFEWLVIDDGSTDGTEEYIRPIIEENRIPIIYRKQKNSGKHVAHNHAVEIASGDIFLCVDSDDMLADEKAVDQLLKLWEKYSEDKSCAGIISYKGLFDGSRIGSAFPKELERVSPFHLAHRYQSAGERNVIYRLEYLKTVPYPVFMGEKFCPDSYISDFLSKDYTMVLHPQIDVLCEYQSDGLSNNFSKLMKNNPKGFCIANMQMIDMTEDIKNRTLTACRYWAFKILIKDTEIRYSSSRNKGLVILCFLPGALWSLYYRLRLQKV